MKRALLTISILLGLAIFGCADRLSDKVHRLAYGSPTFRQDQADILEAGNRAIGPLIDAAVERGPTIDAASASAQTAIVDTLSRIGPDAALAEIVARFDSADAKEQAALVSLSAFLGQNAKELLLRAAGSTSTEVQVAAYASLGRFLPDPSVRKHLSAGLRSSSSLARFTAAYALSSSEPAAVKVIEECARDSNFPMQLRISGVESLGDAPTSAGMAALQRLRKNGPKEMHRYVEETLQFIARGRH
jgi:hypothetical protein